MKPQKTARFLTVGWKPANGQVGLFGNFLTVDMGEEYDAPTEAEMQEIAFAAKMAFAKAIRKRKTAGRAR